MMRMFSQFPKDPLMFLAKAAGYSRTFYLTAVLIWTSAVGLMFITAVWGGFYGMMDAVMRGREARHLAQSYTDNTAASALAPHTVEPNPFENTVAPTTPAGWAVAEAEKGFDALEIRIEKLFHKKPAPTAIPIPLPAPVPVPTPVPAAKSEIRQPVKAAPSAPALMQGEAGEIKALKFQTGTNRFDMSVSTYGTPDKVTFFYLDNPRRLAINIAGPWRNAAQRNEDISTGPISRVAVGEHPDYVRITLHFRDPNAPKPGDPVLTKAKDGLTMVLTTK